MTDEDFPNPKFVGDDDEGEAILKLLGKVDDSVEPERNAAEPDPAPVVHAYPGGKTTPIGTAAEVRRFFAWCRVQDAYPDIQQFAIDCSTDPSAEDGQPMQEFARQLREAIQNVDWSQGVGAALHATAAAILAAAEDGVEGLVVSESAEQHEPEEAKPARYAAVPAAPTEPSNAAILGQVLGVMSETAQSNAESARAIAEFARNLPAPQPINVDARTTVVMPEPPAPDGSAARALERLADATDRLAAKPAPVMPTPPAPIVNVAAPVVNLKPTIEVKPNITVESPPPTRKVIERGADGSMSGIREVPIPPENV